MPPERSGATITGLRSAQHVFSRPRWNRTLVKVETDAGVAGYGEVGANGDTVAGQLAQMEPLLVGEDPVEVTKLYDRMIGQQHSHRPHFPTVSGVDIALWDLAGKLLDRPVSSLTAGQLRDAVPFYINRAPQDLLDPESCQDWAEDLTAGPDAPTAVKLTFDPVIDANLTAQGDAVINRDNPTLTKRQLEPVREAARNVREALGWDLDYIAHCHNEWDRPTAINIAEAVAPTEPIWLEDPLPIHYSDTWRDVTRDAPVRILTGEKLEGVREFEPFVLNGGVDVIQPDLVFAGGITGCRRIGQLADRHHVPMTAHNTGGLVQNAATVHFAATQPNFWITETKYPVADWIPEMGEAPGLGVGDGALTVPEGPGLGVTLDPDVIAEMTGDPDFVEA